MPFPKGFDQGVQVFQTISPATVEVEGLNLAEICDLVESVRTDPQVLRRGRWTEKVFDWEFGEVQQVYRSLSSYSFSLHGANFVPMSFGGLHQTSLKGMRRKTAQICLDCSRFIETETESVVSGSQSLAEMWGQRIHL